MRVQNIEFNGHIKDSGEIIEYSLRYYLLPKDVPSPYSLVGMPNDEISLNKLGKEKISVEVQEPEGL